MLVIQNYEGRISRVNAEFKEALAPVLSRKRGGAKAKLEEQAQALELEIFVETRQAVKNYKALMTSLEERRKRGERFETIIACERAYNKSIDSLISRNEDRLKKFISDHVVRPHAKKPQRAPNGTPEQPDTRSDR